MAMIRLPENFLRGLGTYEDHNGVYALTHMGEHFVGSFMRDAGFEVEYGLADNPEQIAKYAKKVAGKKDYLVHFVYVPSKENGGFRPHKFGNYIGKYKLEYEYLTDDYEEGNYPLEYILSFNVFIGSVQDVDFPIFSEIVTIKKGEYIPKELWGYTGDIDEVLKIAREVYKEQGGVGFVSGNVMVDGVPRFGIVWSIIVDGKRNFVQFV